MGKEVLAKNGDYVTVKLKGKRDARQGVLIGQDKNNNLLIIACEDEQRYYVGEGKPTVVPDGNIFSPETMAHILKIRAKLQRIK